MAGGQPGKAHHLVGQLLAQQAGVADAVQQHELAQVVVFLPVNIGVGIDLPGLLIARLAQRELAAHPEAHIFQVFAEDDGVGAGLVLGLGVRPDLIPLCLGQQDLNAPHARVIEHRPVVHAAGSREAHADRDAVGGKTALGIGNAQGNGIVAGLGIQVVGVSPLGCGIEVKLPVAIQVPLVAGNLRPTGTAAIGAEIDHQRRPALVRHGAGLGGHQGALYSGGGAAPARKQAGKQDPQPYHHRQEDGSDLHPSSYASGTQSRPAVHR